MHVRDQTNIMFAYIVYNMSAFSACILYFLVAKWRNCTHWGSCPQECVRGKGAHLGAALITRFPSVYLHATRSFVVNARKVLKHMISRGNFFSIVTQSGGSL